MNEPLNEPQRFRKKPVVIEAMLLGAYTEGMAPAPWKPEGGSVWRWLTAHGASFHMDQEDPGPAFMRIVTLEGEMTASIGDWIIRGVAGEFYPCKSDIFAATYEKVAGDASVPEVRGDQAP